MGSFASAGTALYYAGCEDHLYEPHFLLSCYLCNRPIGFNSDVFMYRGDMPFCSKDCREEQIEMDEAEERRKKWTKSNNSRSKNITSSSSSSSSSSPSPSSSSTSSSSRKSEPVAVA